MAKTYTQLKQELAEAIDHGYKVGDKVRVPYTDSGQKKTSVETVKRVSKQHVHVTRGFAGVGGLYKVHHSDVIKEEDAHN